MPAAEATPFQPVRLVGDLLRLNAASGPDREALVVGDRRLTYAELDRRSDLVAAALPGAGVRHGDRVAILGRNSLDYFSLYFATAKLGALLVPLNFWHRAEEHRYVVEDSQPTVVLHEPEFAGVLASAVGADGPELVELAPCGAAPTASWQDFLAKVDEEGVAGRSPDPTDAHMILYTSGTTGRPKGPVLSHACTVQDALGMGLALGVRPAAVFLKYFPPFHVGNWDHMKLFLVVGARVVLLPEFDAGSALGKIQAERVTVVLGVSTMLRALLEHPAWDATDRSSIRLLYFGAYDPSGIMRRTADALGAPEGRVAMAHTYGLTEAGPFFTLCRPEHVFDKWGSIGQPIPGVEVQLLDGDDHRVAVGEPGEICVRGPVMSGHWRRDEATREAFAGGWLHTGDVAVADDDGFLRIVDRAKDMIRSGGQNVYSKEVEECLLTHPRVADCAVIGVADAAYEEAACAVVVVSGAPGDSTLADELRRWVRARRAGYNVPKRIEIVEALPRNAVGKTLKGELRSTFGSVFSARGAQRTQG